MRKPRPFVTGMLCGSMAMSPAAWAMARTQDAPADAIVIQSGGIEALLVDEKDAGLKRALMMLDERILELPAEVDDPNMPAGMIKTVWENLISPMSLRFGMTEQPAEGEAPFHAQLVVHSMEPGSARSTAGMIASMLEQQGAEWGEGPMGGVRMTQAPFGRMMLGATAVNGHESLVIGMNTLDLDAPDVDVSGLLPKGVKPAMAVHADMKRMTPVMEMIMQQPDAAMFRDLMISSGMMGQDAIVMDMAFGHGEDRMYGGLVMHDYAKTAANWGALPGQTLPAAILRAIPADATYAQAGMFDWSALPDMLREFAAQAGETEDPFQVMAEDLGFNPDTDLIAHLGNTFAMYQSDTTGGGGLMSMVAIVSLKDSAAFARTHDQIRTKVNQLGAREAKGYVRIHSWNEAGITVYTMLTPGLPIPLEVSWAIVGDHLIAGATPAALLTAAAQLRAPKSSILDNKKVVEMAGGRLDDVMAFEFVDTPRHARLGYGVASAVGAMLANAVRSPSDPARNPGPVMMPFNDFVKDIQPMVAVGRWQGDDLKYTWQGDRSMMVNIAGAGGAMGGLVGIAVIGAMAGALLPAMSRARESAKQVKSMSTLRSITQGVMMYAAEHDDQLPPSLDAIMAEYLVGLDMNSPFGPAWDGAGDYGYRSDLGGETFASFPHPSSTIVAIDRAMLLNHGNTAAAFLDGHVEFVDSGVLSRYLEQEHNRGAVDSLGIPDWMRP